MFSTKLTLALAGLGLAAALQAAAALWSIGVADRQVLRGRVASDIHVAFVELSVTKQRLRSWVAQRQADAGADAAQRDALLDEMRGTLRHLDRLARQAPNGGGAGDAAADATPRAEAVAALERGVAALDRASRGVEPLAADADARPAWQALSEQFDRPDGLDLRALLSASMQREAEAVARERRAADASLDRARSLWAGAAAALCLAALALAAYFARALRRPLALLRDGAAALQRGELGHRIALAERDEFGLVARSMNAMAAELGQHRQREVEDRQRLEQLVQSRTAELRTALASLQQVDQRRRQLFADVSHELRTPATAIRGEAQVAMRGRDKTAQEYKESLERIVGAAAQLGQVIGDLLAVARDDIDALIPQRDAIDLRAPIEAALDQARALAGTRQVSVEDAALPAGPLPLLADSARLQQLLVLLLDNAVRYSRPGEAVRLCVESRQPAVGAPLWEVRVEDHGIGIPEDELPQVFERHFRGARARRHFAGGSGLGLAIGAALTRAHGGQLSLESRPGGGTIARLVLPQWLGDPSNRSSAA
jgi:two-component system OmpR family sensor kinase